MDKQQLAAKIWNAANKMRGSLDASDYKDLILGLMFYKYLSDHEITFFEKGGIRGQTVKEQLTALGAGGGSKGYNQSDVVAHLGYFIAYENLFSSWVANLPELKSTTVIEAIGDFESKAKDSVHAKLYEGVFTPLVQAIGKLGSDTLASSKKLRELIRIVKDIPTAAEAGYDVLGFIYEYLISHFAANAGKTAGEFYTPHEVALVMAEIVADHVKDLDEIKVYETFMPQRIQTRANYDLAA